MLVGVVVHSADIFPALISSPYSASRRRISVDFQMPRSAAFSRRFQRIGSPPDLSQAGGDPVVGLRPRLFYVVIVNVDVAGRGGQPRMAEQFLDGFEVH